LPGVQAQEHIAALIPHLRRYARALAATGAAPDELVRATLERAAQELRLAHAQADLRVWLFSLLHETYVANAAGRDVEGAVTPAEGAPGGAAFERAIATLPPLQREIFLLVTLEDMSYEQVAKTLDIPIGTVMSRLSRARESLLRAMEAGPRATASSPALRRIK
jgi:DNA-directed RNA polymerase specialized sigma24 family protein